MNDSMLQLAAEIVRMQNVVSKTDSFKLKKDYNKAIKRKRNELKYYCNQKNLCFGAIMKEGELRWQTTKGI